jgi:predicted nucleic acid-binding protein
MKSYVLDTSVIVEKIIRNSPYREKVEQLFSAQRSGTVKLFVAIPTLSETLYIASRIYQLAGVNNANEEALNYISWLKTKIIPVNIDEETAIVAGELKKTTGSSFSRLLCNRRCPKNRWISIIPEKGKRNDSERTTYQQTPRKVFVRRDFVTSFSLGRISIPR